MRVRENFRDDPILEGGFLFPDDTDNGVAGTECFLFVFSGGVLEIGLEDVCTCFGLVPLFIDADED